MQLATWNIAHRPLSKDDSGVFLVAGVPLRFYHFTGYDSGAGFGMLARYASSQAAAHELWDSYAKDIKAEGQGDTTLKSWFYGNFENGESIPAKARRLYQQRVDVQKAFPFPYSMEEPSYFSWWKAETNSGLNQPVDGGVTTPSIGRLVARSFISPNTARQNFKTVVRVIKRDGVVGFIKKMIAR